MRTSSDLQNGHVQLEIDSDLLFYQFRNSSRRFKSNSERRSRHGKLKGLDLYSAIVSYVITLFNGIDMMYSKLQHTKIQMNIAGIVIGTVSILNLEVCKILSGSK